MLNRRYYRIKIMQALYAYNLKQDLSNVSKHESELFKSFDKIHELYIFVLHILMRLQHQAHINIEENLKKYRPTNEDLKPNLKFVNNTIIKAIIEHKELKNSIEKKEKYWSVDNEFIRKLFYELKQTEGYHVYMQNEENNLVNEKNILTYIISDFLYNHNLFIHFIEELYIDWNSDAYAAFSLALKTIDSFSNAQIQMCTIFKDEVDDKEFISTLFNKTIEYNIEFEKLIASKTQNWDLERIANMDILLMKMALSEILHMPQMPVKVSLNEYIDIAKEFSSANSKNFINGILDSIISQLNREDKIQKSGRGLIEN